MTLFYDTFTTPLGDFSAAVDAAGSVVATAFGELPILQTRLTSASLPREPSLSRNGGATHWARDELSTRAVREQVLAYFAGGRKDFDLPLAPAGTAFQLRVWAGLRTIPFGATRSYGGLATELGQPGAARAVGRANATNPLCLIVPCHRVIGSDGSLTGFAFGEAIKRRLLSLEGVAFPARR